MYRCLLVGFFFMVASNNSLGNEVNLQKCLSFWDNLEDKLKKNPIWSIKTSSESQLDFNGFEKDKFQNKTYRYKKREDSLCHFSNFQVSKFAEQGDPLYLLGYYGESVLRIIGIKVTKKYLYLPNPKY